MREEGVEALSREGAGGCRDRRGGVAEVRTPHRRRRQRLKPAKEPPLRSPSYCERSLVDGVRHARHVPRPFRVPGPKWYGRTTVGGDRPCSPPASLTLTSLSFLSPPTDCPGLEVNSTCRLGATGPSSFSPLIICGTGTRKEGSSRKPRGQPDRIGLWCPVPCPTTPKVSGRGRSASCLPSRLVYTARVGGPRPDVVTGEQNRRELFEVGTYRRGEDRGHPLRIKGGTLIVREGRQKG